MYIFVRYFFMIKHFITNGYKATTSTNDAIKTDI